jgi:hypothetical protein
VDKLKSSNIVAPFTIWQTIIQASKDCLRQPILYAKDVPAVKLFPWFTLNPDTVPFSVSNNVFNNQTTGSRSGDEGSKHLYLFPPSGGREFVGSHDRSPFAPILRAVTILETTTFKSSSDAPAEIASSQPRTSSARQAEALLPVFKGGGKIPAFIF